VGWGRGREGAGGEREFPTHTHPHTHTHTHTHTDSGSSLCIQVLLIRPQLLVGFYFLGTVSIKTQLSLVRSDLEQTKQLFFVFVFFVFLQILRKNQRNISFIKEGLDR